MRAREAAGLARLSFAWRAEMLSTSPGAGSLEDALAPLLTASLLTRTAFVTIVAVVVCERLFEVWLSRFNARRVLARGGVEFGAGHYPVMVALHSAFFVAMVAEVLWLPTRPRGWLTLFAVVVAAAAMVLRYWAIVSLNDRWNTRVIVEPGRLPVKRGPYRFMRHPNYVAVVLEILFLPLIHAAWRTAAVFTVANLVLLRHRIKVEEAAVYGASWATATGADDRRIDHQEFGR